VTYATLAESFAVSETELFPISGIISPALGKVKGWLCEILTRCFGPVLHGFDPFDAALDMSNEQMHTNEGVCVKCSHGEDSGNSATRPDMLAPEKGPISPDMGRLMAAIGPDSNVRQKIL
jgi:hypothetical protein